MQIADFITPEIGPIFTGLHPFHEQIRNPIRCVHIMGSATIVTSILPELKKFQECRSARTLNTHNLILFFSPLVHRTKLIIVHFQKWNHSLTFTIGTRNMTTRSTNGDVQLPPKPPAHLDKKAFSAMPLYMIDSMVSSTLYKITGGQL